MLASRVRITALVKYLVTLSKSFCPRETDARIDTTKPGDENEGLGKIVRGKVQQPPDPAFKRLHILYVLHDVLSHIARHGHGSAFYSNETFHILRSGVLAVAELAACDGKGRSSRTQPLVYSLLGLWRRTGIFNSDEIERTRDKVFSAGESDWDTLLSKLTRTEASEADEVQAQRESEMTWILPDRHGVINDPTAPWHELPAANGLYLKRTYGYPLRASALPPGGVSLRNAGELII